MQSSKKSKLLQFYLSHKLAESTTKIIKKNLLEVSKKNLQHYKIYVEFYYCGILRNKTFEKKTLLGVFFLYLKFYKTKSKFIIYKNFYL